MQFNTLMSNALFCLGPTTNHLKYRIHVCYEEVRFAENSEYPWKKNFKKSFNIFMMQVYSRYVIMYIYLVTTFNDKK